MAKLYLEANETFNVSNNVQVIGSTGTEGVLITGTPDVDLDANVERVDLSGNVADYTFQIDGTTITIFNAGNPVATFAGLNQDATIKFADGSAVLSLTGLDSATLGGREIPAAAAAVVPITINAADISSTAGAGAAGGLSIADVTVTEGNSGTTTAQFTVSLSQAPATGETVTVDYTTADSSATAASLDFTATSGTLTFAAGETTKTIDVMVTGDTTFETDEVFNVNLSNATGMVNGQAVSIDTATATGTIINDDAAGGTFVLTSGTDSGAGFIGSAANDTFQGPITLGVQTLGNTDQLDGGGSGADSDTLLAQLNVASTIPATIRDIETLQFVAQGAAASTIDLANATGIDSIQNLQSAQNLTVNNIQELVALTVQGTGVGTTFEFADALLTGTSDTLSVTLDGASGTEAMLRVGRDTDNDGGFEILNIATQGGASDFDTDNDDDGTDLGLDMMGLMTVNVTGTAALDLGERDLTNTIITFDASGNSAGVSADFGNPAALATDLMLTGGSGNDDFDLSAFNANADPTVNMNDGNDRVTVTAANVQDDYLIEGGNGTDTLEADDDFGAVDRTQEFTGFETLEFEAAPAAGLAVAQDMDLLTSTINSVVIDITDSAGAETVTLTNLDDGDTVSLTRDLNTGADKVVLQGDPGVNSLTFTLDDAANAGVTLADLDIDANIQSVTIQSNETGGGNTENHVLADVTGLTSVTQLTATGSAGLDMDTTALGAATVVIDASAMTAAFEVKLGATASAAQVTGGSAGDTLDTTGVGAAVTITGNDGADAIALKGNAQADTVVYNAITDGGDTGTTGDLGNDNVTDFLIANDSVGIGGALRTAIDRDADGVMDSRDSVGGADNSNVGTQASDELFHITGSLTDGVAAADLTDGTVTAAAFNNIAAELNSEFNFSNTGAGTYLIAVNTALAASLNAAVFVWQNDAAADDAVTASELTLLGTFTADATTTVADFVFV